MRKAWFRPSPPPDDDQPPGSFAARLGWFALLAIAGATAVVVSAYILRGLLLMA